jgi:hypothetical protein
MAAETKKKRPNRSAPKSCGGWLEPAKRRAMERILADSGYVPTKEEMDVVYAKLDEIDQRPPHPGPIATATRKKRANRSAPVSRAGGLRPAQRAAMGKILADSGYVPTKEEMDVVYAKLDEKTGAHLTADTGS